ncbi:MAG: UDP-glucose 4-epimerase GalE [Bdellovibrionota bacterium]
MKTKVLITGGAGYIGSHVAHQMIEGGFDITILDNLSTGHRWAVPDGAKFVQMELGEEASVREFLQREKFDALIHFAASIQVGESVSKPELYYRNNTMNTLRLFEAAKASGIKSIVFSSTAAVYGELHSGLLKETDRLRPINPYGWSKFMSEQILCDLAAASNGALKYVILRYFNVAGARPDLKIGQSGAVVTHLIKIASQAAVGLRDGMQIFGTDYATADGTCERDYIHVEDLSRAHLDALSYLSKGGQSDVFNVGYGHATSVRTVIDTVKRVSGVNFKVTEGARRAGDPAMLAADSTKIRKALGWEPRFDDLDEICRTAFEWEKKLRSKG